MGWKLETAQTQWQAQQPSGWPVWLAPSTGIRLGHWTLVLLCVVTLTAALWPALPAAAAAPQAPLAQAPSDGALAIVGAGGATLYTTPGGEQVATLAAGAVLTAVGRSSDSLWVVVYQSNGVAGWVEADQVVLFGLAELPVMIEGSQPSAPSQPAQGSPATPAAGTPAAGAPVALPTLTPTPMPSPTPLPTATPTPLPSPTPSPTPTPEPTPLQIGGGQGSLVAVVRGGGTALYDRPDGEVIAQLTTGTALTAWGRSGDTGWLVVTTSTSIPGWVQASKVVAFDLDTLPVVDGAAAAQTTAGSTQAPAVPAQMPEGAAPAEPARGDSEIYASVAVTDSRLNIRTGPGTTYAILGKAQPGESFVATGRNSQSSWVEIATPELGDGYGWVAAEFVTLSGPIASLPVSDQTGPLTPVAATPSAATPASVRTGADPAPAARPISGSGPTGLSGRLAIQGAGGAMIYVYELETGSLYELTGGFDPAISPDGRTVAFTRVGGENGLYLIDIDGRNERRIFAGSENLRAPAWSPDGQWIAFVRLSGSYKCRDLGFGLCLGDNPFLEGFPLDERPEWGLSRVDINGEEYRDLPALTSVQAPDWHENGIVYGAVSSLEITQDDPGATTRVLVTENYYQDPTWQPGGDRIVFQSREGSHWEIFTIHPDGSGVAALTRPVTTLVDELPSNVAPAWSPDGQAIAYLSNRDAQNDAGEWRLWVMDADGGNQRPLPLNVPLEYSYANEQVVSWGVFN